MVVIETVTDIMTDTIMVTVTGTIKTVRTGIMIEMTETGAMVVD
jgi:hypothetical protein